jgi:hypothetical protein
MNVHEVYVTVHEYGGNCGPVLRCVACPEWEVDVDGMSLSAAAKRGAEHETDGRPA